MNPNYYFKCLEKNEINECAKLASRIFANFDPFIRELKIPESELYKNIVFELESIINDNLITIAKKCDDNSIIGCYAGFKLSKLKFFEKKQKIESFSVYKLDEKQLRIEEKYEILENIDYNILKKFYEVHKLKKEIDQAIFCDYYCISDEYFSTNLGRDLALNFFKNCRLRNIKHIYGTFFNIRAIKLLTKHFPAQIVHEIKVLFQKNQEEKMEYKVLLLYGDLYDQKMDFALNNAKL